MNGTTVYSKIFGDTGSTCLWIDEDSPTYAITDPELRAHPAWQAFASSLQVPPFSISNDEIVSRIEGIIGDQLHGTGGYWGHFYGSAWVEAERLDSTALRVDLDLSADVIGLDPEVDVSFNLRFRIQCDPPPSTAATFRIETENIDVSVDFDLLEEIFTGGLVNFAEGAIAAAIQESIQPIVQLLALETGGRCPTVEVDAAGNVNFALPPG